MVVTYITLNSLHLLATTSIAINIGIATIFFVFAGKRLLRVTQNFKKHFLGDLETE